MSPTNHQRCGACSAPLREILLDHLQSAMLLPAPGADGLTLDDAVDCYPLGIEAGLVPGGDALAQLHPEMADEIKTLFPKKTNSLMCWGGPVRISWYRQYAAISHTKGQQS